MTVTSALKYLIPGSASSAALVILWAISIHQLCITARHEQPRLRHAVHIILWTTCAAICNSLCYASCMYPDATILQDVNITDIWYFFEMCFVVVGLHIFRIFNAFIINKLYEPMNTELPTCVAYTYTVFQLLISVMALTCYPLHIANALPSIPWIDIFYVLLSSAIMGQALIDLFVFRRVMRLLSHIGWPWTRAIYKAKRAMEIAIYAALTIILVTLSIVVIEMGIMLNFLGHSVDTAFLNCIGHSVLFLVFSPALLLWQCKKGRSCKFCQRKGDANCGIQQPDQNPRIAGLLLQASSQKQTTFVTNSEGLTQASFDDDVDHESSLQGHVCVTKDQGLAKEPTVHETAFL